MTTVKLQHFARLRELSKRDSTIVALVLCERMAINARVFLQAQQQLSDIDTIDAMLNQCWSKALSRKSKLNLDTIQLKLEALFELTNSDSLAAQSTRDFLVCLGICVDAFANSEEYPAVQVAKVSQGDIERFLEATSDIEITREAFREHELVVFELQILDSMLDFFAEEPSPHDILQMKEDIKSIGISNLGVSATEA